MFARWLETILKPNNVQLLTVKQKTLDRSPDELPAIKNARKMLMKLSGEYAYYYIKVVKPLLRKRKRSSLIKKMNP